MPEEYYIDPHAPAPLFNHPWGGRGLFRDPDRGAMRRLPDPNDWRLVQGRVLGMPNPPMYRRNIRLQDGKLLLQPYTAPYGPYWWK
jgi:hypothetical protein